MLPERNSRQASRQAIERAGTRAPLLELESLRAVDRLDDLVSGAWQVPPSDRVMVDRATLTGLVAKLPAALSADLGPATERSAALLVCARELEVVAAAARALPLTSLVGGDKQAVYGICDEVRAGIANEITTVREAAPALAGVATASSPLVEVATRLSDWPPQGRETSSPAYLHTWFLSAVIAIIAGVALGASSDPSLYSIAVIGAVNVAAVALVRFWVLRPVRADVGGGAEGRTAPGARDR